MLAEAKTMDDILQVADIAEAAKAYARAAKLGMDAQNNAAEVAILARRKAGEYLAQLERNQGERNDITSPNVGRSSEYSRTLQESGITTQDASRWMQVASVPEEQFREYIEDTKQAGKELATSSVVKLAKQIIRKDIEVKRVDRESVINLYKGDMLDVLKSSSQKYDLIVADPPYNVTPWEWDKLGTRQEFTDLTTSWIKAILEHTKDKFTMFWFCSPSYMADIEFILRKLDLPIQSRLVWHRRNMAKGSDAKYKFVDSWEMIFHISNRELNFPSDWDDTRFDVQTFAVPQTNFNDTKYHPTQKPLDLIKCLVSYGSYDGDIILDPFAGSGTTAATIDNRIFDLIEMNEDYLSIIEQRFGINYE
jgi:DNA modification methylase